MTVVFVHGVPETAAIWEPLVAVVARDDTTCLSLPGFGEPLPDGFEPTMYRYAEWLGQELATIDEVDLVGHDWGALLSARVLAERPPNVRTWALDIGDLTGDHKWHGAAKMWQTPDEGERFADAWIAMGAQSRAEMMEGVGAPSAAARVMGDAIDVTMCQAILGLYRSAVDIGREWGPGIDDWGASGLVIAALDDQFRKPELARALARRTGADILELPGVGHWWMQQEPERVAAALQELWESAAA